MVSLASLTRPNTVTIFADDPVNRGKLAAFILTNAAIPSSSSVRFDLVQSGSVSRTFAVSRNPVEQLVTSKIKRNPPSLTVSGTLSATPLIFGGVLGALHSFVRLDLKARDVLVKIAERLQPVIAVCPWGVFGSMGVDSIVEDHPGAEKVDLTITMSEILIVSELLVEAKIDLDALLAGAPTDAALGTQPTEVVSAPAGLGLGALG